MLGLFKKSADKETLDQKSSLGSVKQKNFAGMSGKQISDALNNSGPKMSLVSQEVSSSAQKAIMEVAGKEKAGIKVTQSEKLFEEVATMFAEGDDKSSIEIIRNHIKDNKGEVDKRYWFMLLDIYQINKQKNEFEKAALIFANQFNCSPPSWPFEDDDKETTTITGKNLLILNKITFEEKDKIKDFIKHSKEEKFCRIDITKIKFDDSDIEGLQMLLNTMYELRKSKVLSLLLGENNLTNFCKQYIKALNPNPNNDSLNKLYLNNSSLFWLLYLEVMQWKNRSEEFEDLAINYAVEFELSAPGWDENGVMRVESSIIKQQISEDIENVNKLPNFINTENIQSLFDFIDEKSNSSDHDVLIDIKNVDRIDFAGAGSFLNYIQEFNSKNESKKIILDQPNELLMCLFETIGIHEFVDIRNKKR